MESEEKCACKGIRTCLSCEKSNKLNRITDDNLKNVYTYCHLCGHAWHTQDNQICDDIASSHPDHEGESIVFPGVCVLGEFITTDEEQMLIDEMDKTHWVDSQSGRRKQDYGPKVNFKKKRLKTSVFTGLPAFSKFLVDRMQASKPLLHFDPVELCNLEYTPERGSSIDPHFDDSWLWGERLVTVTLMSDTRHTMSTDDRPDIEVVIPLPQRSVVVVQGAARHRWKHGIKRNDIRTRRLGMTFRELTPEFLTGGQNEEIGRELLDIAASFNGLAVGSNGV